MARINLLPWRQWERERKQRNFVANLAGVVLVGFVLVFAGGWVLDGQLEERNQLNNKLTTDIAELDKKIVEIANLEKEREELLARMRVIQELQGNRPVIVRIFDELSRKLAKGVHFTKLSMQGNRLSVQGFAESNNRISSLMRNLDKSDWFANPNLKSIREDDTNTDYGLQASSFELSFDQVSPKVSEDN